MEVAGPRYYLQRWPSVRAMKVIRARIKEATVRRYVGEPLNAVTARLNPVLRG